MQLKGGSKLQNGKYRIIRVLGQGGFGITYLAENTLLDRKVAIKEFFPKDFCGRDNSSHLTLGTQNNTETVAKLKDRFLKEAKNIAKLDHPGIVKIHDIFEENNTAYYVMDYIEGENLNEMVKRDGPLSETKAVEYIKKVGEALEYIHTRNMTHFDVKPANIVIRKKDDSPVLIDFGLSKQYDMHGDATSTLMQGVSHGYSPIELYNSGSITSFSPQTDVYSLGATFYFLLTGTVPPPASEILDCGLSIPSNISDLNSSVIQKSMSLSRTNRPKHINSFIKLLSIQNNTQTFSQTSISDLGEETSLIDNNSIITEYPQSTPIQSYASDINLTDYNAEKDFNKHKFIKYTIYIGLPLIVLMVILCFVFKSSSPKTRNIVRVESNVQNPDNILSAQEVYSLSVFNDSINSNFDISIVSLIIDDSKINVLKQFTDSIFNVWGIGDKDTNRGILIAINKAKREITLTTGLGLESVLPDDSCKVIIDNMITYCKEEDYYEALRIASADICRMLDMTNDNQSDEEIFIAVEQPAEFPGGVQALMTWLSDNIRYPEIAQQNDVQGRVLVKFVVEKDGSISEVSIDKGVNKDLEKEAIRVVKSMPKWNPAKNDGITVRSYFMIPINFKLKD